MTRVIIVTHGTFSKFFKIEWKCSCKYWENEQNLKLLEKSFLLSISASALQMKLWTFFREMTFFTPEKQQNKNNYSNQAMKILQALLFEKSTHESSHSIQSMKMRFWMIFKLTSSKNMDFSDFKARPQGMMNFGGSNLGSKVLKISFS